MAVLWPGEGFVELLFMGEEVEETVLGWFMSGDDPGRSWSMALNVAIVRAFDDSIV